MTEFDLVQISGSRQPSTTLHALTSVNSFNKTDHKDNNNNKMAIDPAMKQWPMPKVHARFVALEGFIAAHGPGDGTKAQIKRQNKQIVERNHLADILRKNDYNDPQHHQLSYTAIQPKPLPQAKQPSTTETQAQQIKLSPRAAGTASRITSQHNPYPRQQELPESEDHHDKYYTTSDPSIIVPLHTQQPKTNGLANNSPRISARSRSRKYHKDTRLDIQDSNPQSPHSVEEQPHIDRMANDTMTSESFLQAKQRILQDARGISDPKVIVPAAISTSHNALSSNKSPNARERGRDEIVAPSLQSGGVPEPTPYYLAQSLVPSVICPNLQPILVVIDLNGTILHRGGRSRTEFIERPFAQQFLNYMFHNFIVMIWSSARPENTYAMCNRILPPDQLRRTAAVWGRDRFGLTTSDYTRRVQVYKRLNSVWADSSIAMKHPYFDNCQEWNQTNTILIDDSREKGRSDPFNLLPVPEFVGAMEDPDILRKVAEYLDLAKFQTNVSSFMRSYPFDVSKIHVNRCAEELERMRASGL